ncbi:MAG: hypothetical protein AAGJ73_13460 [Pseudomonadota bacterium]
MGGVFVAAASIFWFSATALMRLLSVYNEAVLETPDFERSLEKADRLINIADDALETHRKKHPSPESG